MELDQILQLIDKVSDSSLTAFDYEADGIKIAMEHGKAAPVQVQMSGVPSGAGLQMAEMMGGANGVTVKEAAMPERKETAGDELELIDDRFKELSTTSNDAKMTLVKAKPEKKATVKKR